MNVTNMNIESKGIHRYSLYYFTSTFSQFQKSYYVRNRCSCIKVRMFLHKSVYPIVPTVIYPWHSANFWHCCFSLKARTRKPSFKLWLQSRKDTYLVLSLEWQQLWHFRYHQLSQKYTRYCLDLVVGSFPFDQAQIQYP